MIYKATHARHTLEASARTSLKSCFVWITLDFAVTSDKEKQEPADFSSLKFLFSCATNQRADPLWKKPHRCMCADIWTHTRRLFKGIHESYIRCIDERRVGGRSGNFVLSLRHHRPAALYEIRNQNQREVWAFWGSSGWRGHRSLSASLWWGSAFKEKSKLCKSTRGAERPACHCAPSLCSGGAWHPHPPLPRHPCTTTQVASSLNSGEEFWRPLGLNIWMTDAAAAETGDVMWPVTNDARLEMSWWAIFAAPLSSHYGALSPHGSNHPDGRRRTSDIRCWKRERRAPEANRSTLAN